MLSAFVQCTALYSMHILCIALPHREIRHPASHINVPNYEFMSSSFYLLATFFATIFELQCVPNLKHSRLLFLFEFKYKKCSTFSPSHLSFVYVIYFISLNSFLSLSFSEMNYKDFSATLISRFIYFWMDVALLMDWNTNKYTVKCEWLRCN